MRKYIILVLALVCMLGLVGCQSKTNSTVDTVTISAVAETSANEELNDTVYRGEKYEFDFGVPKNETLVILPQDREQPQVDGNVYVGRVEKETPQHSIVLLDE